MIGQKLTVVGNGTVYFRFPPLLRNQIKDNVVTFSVDTEKCEMVIKWNPKTP